MKPKFHQGYWFCGEEYLLGLNFELKSHRTADLWKLFKQFAGKLDIRKNSGTKREENVFAGSRYQKNSTIDVQ